MNEYGNDPVKALEVDYEDSFQKNKSEIKKLHAAQPMCNSSSVA